MWSSMPGSPDDDLGSRKRRSTLTPGRALRKKAVANSWARLKNLWGFFSAHAGFDFPRSLGISCQYAQNVGSPRSAARTPLSGAPPRNPSARRAVQVPRRHQSPPSSSNKGAGQSATLAADGGTSGPPETKLSGTPGIHPESFQPTSAREVGHVAERLGCYLYSQSLHFFEIPGQSSLKTTTVQPQPPHVV